MSQTSYSGKPDAEGIPPVRPLSDRDHPNARMLKEAHESFQEGNFERLFGIFHDDMIWRVPGSNRLSGVYRGREEIMGNFKTLMEVADTYWAHPLDYFGSDDHVVLVAHVRATRGDKTLDEKEALVFRVEDGKLAECWHLGFDPEGWDAFFA